MLTSYPMKQLEIDIMFNHTSTLDKLPSVEKEINEEDKILLLASVNGKTSKLKPKQLSNLLGSGGGNGETPNPNKDYIPIEQKGAPDGIASLDKNGFVPSEQLNIGSSSGPFVVKPWDAFKAEEIGIPPNPSKNITTTETNGVTKIDFRQPIPEDLIFKNSFFKSSDEIEYKNGKITYTGEVKGNSQIIPYPYIGFNNVNNFSFVYSDDPSSYSGDFVLIYTRAAKIDDALVPSSKTPVSFQVMVTGDKVMMQTEQYTVKNGDVVKVYKNGNQWNWVVGDFVGNFNFEGDPRPNPDMAWNLFVALIQPINSETKEYDKSYSIPIGNIYDTNWGGNTYKELPKKFKVQLKPLGVDDRYNYTFALDNVVTSSLSNLYNKQILRISFFPAYERISIIASPDGTITNLPYDPTQPVDLEFDVEKTTVTINGVEYKDRFNNIWLAMTAMFFNFFEDGIYDDPVSFSYSLEGFSKQELIPSPPPTGAKDGEVFKVTKGGLFNDTIINEDDFVVFYNSLSEIMITRLPPNIDESSIETMLDFKIQAIQAENKSYVDDKFKSNRFNYRGTFQSRGNVWIENPIEGDYVIVTDWGTKAIPYYYLNASGWSLGGSGSGGLNITNTDDIPEGMNNKFFTDNGALSYLQSNGYLTLFNIEDQMTLGRINPKGDFESSKNKVTGNLSQNTNNPDRYPTVKATVDYVNECLNKIYHVNSVSSLIQTLKEVRQQSSDGNLKELSSSTQPGTLVGQLKYLRESGETFDSNYRDIPLTWELDDEDGFVLDIGIAGQRSGNPLIDSEFMLGIHYAIPDVISMDQSFIGIQYLNNEFKWVVKGVDVNSLTLKTLSGDLNQYFENKVRFVFKGDSLFIYEMYDNGALNKIGTVDRFQPDFCRGRRPSSMLLISDVKSGNKLTKLSVTYRGLIAF